MTIAAGFRFNGGILICADTEQTYAGSLKVSDTKIVKIEDFYPEAKVAFAISGSVDLAIMATEKFKQECGTITLTRQSIKDALESVLIRVHSEHIHPHPAYGTERGPAFDLIASVWTKIDGLTLLASSETAVREVKNYTCAGMGLYLARYLIDLIPDRNMSRSDVEFWAIYILQQVKAYVPFCGGPSEFLFMDNHGGITSKPKVNVSQQEQDITTIQSTIAELIPLSADLNMSDETVKSGVDMLKELLLVAREERRKQEERLKRVQEIIAKRRNLEP